MKPQQPQQRIKSPAELERDREAKMAAIRQRLDEIRKYKKLLREDGLEPDEDDKALESELIVQLLRLEKGLDAKPKPKKAPGRGKTREKPNERESKARPGPRGKASEAPHRQGRRPAR